MKKIKCFFKFFICFTGKANYYISPNSTMRDTFLYQVDPFGI